MVNPEVHCESKIHRESRDPENAGKVLISGKKQSLTSLTLFLTNVTMGQQMKVWRIVALFSLVGKEAALAAIHPPWVY